jgi:hypothetical protein
LVGMDGRSRHNDERIVTLMQDCVQLEVLKINLLLKELND